MRYYIDTNVLASIFVNELPLPIQDIINNSENIIYVSSASVQEFIHLFKIGKIKPNKNSKSISAFGFIENDLNFTIKYVTKEHIKKFNDLEIIEGHNDPTDHLIISQAISEKITLISSDQKFIKYKNQGLDLISYKRK